MTDADPRRERVLIALDSEPHGGVDPLAWRVEQYVSLFDAADADVEVTLVGPAGAQSTVFGRPCGATGLDLDTYWRQVDDPFGVVVALGGGTAHRFVRSVRSHQPHAAVVVDASTLLSVERPRLPDAEVRDDERGGRERIADLRRQRDAELLDSADFVWVRSRREAEHVRSVDPKVTIEVFEPPSLLVDVERGRDLVMLVAPHRDFGEPDLGAVARVAQALLPDLDDDAHVRVVTERAVPLWAERYPEVEFVERVSSVAEHLAGAALVIAPRAHGTTAWAPVLAAQAAGVPVVATPEAVRGLDDPSNGVVVAPLEQFSSAVRTALASPPARARLEQPRRAELLTALGLQSGVVHEADEWLVGARLSRRHDHERQRYLRDSAQVEIDPAPETGADLPERPLISILTPVYDTPLQVLDEMVDSVRRQIYERWELVLVDDASPDPAVRDRCREHAAGDDRIRFVAREHNGGIAAASNTA